MRYLIGKQFCDYKFMFVTCTMNMRLQTYTSVWLCLAQYFFLSACCTYTTINTRKHQVIFHYSQETRSEKNLPICDETSVCSVLHKRYWLPPIADRLCRCVNNDECPWRWATEPHNNTMTLNNRAQLKFCSPINHLKQCDSHSTAVTTENESIQNVKTKFNVKVQCLCSSNQRWQHFRTTRHITKINSTVEVRVEYKCSPLKRCHTLEVCGNVRTDYNSIYYSCSCPMGHFCEYNDKSLYNVEELLYKGSAYKALCVPYDENVEYDY